MRTPGLPFFIRMGMRQQRQQQRRRAAAPPAPLVGVGTTARILHQQGLPHIEANCVLCLRDRPDRLIQASFAPTRTLHQQGLPHIEADCYLCILASLEVKSHEQACRVSSLPARRIADSRAGTERERRARVVYGWTLKDLSERRVAAIQEYLEGGPVPFGYEQRHLAVR